MNEIETLQKSVEQFTNAAQTTLKDQSEEINELKQEVKSLAHSFNDIAQKSAYAPMMRTGRKTPLQTFASDERVKAFVSDRGIKSASVSLECGITELMGTKSIVVGDQASSTTDLIDVQPQRVNSLGEMAFRRLTLLDVLPRIVVASNSLDFNQLDGYTSAADYQAAEGSPFAQGSVPTTLVTARIATIAHYVKLSTQVAADSPALLAQLESLLRYGVGAKLCREIVVGSDTIEGLESFAGTFNMGSGVLLPDAIGAAAVELEVNGWNPTHVLMHPSTWHQIRADRAEDSTYVVGNWATSNANTIWGLQVVTDPAVTEGEPMVFDASQVAILDRQSARVELGREADDMTRGLVTMLAEVRAGLAVFGPSALLKIV